MLLKKNKKQEESKIVFILRTTNNLELCSLAREREREWRGRTEAHDVTGNEQLLVINLLLVAGSSEKLKERKKKVKIIRETESNLSLPLNSFLKCLAKRVKKTNSNTRSTKIRGKNK